MFNKRNVLPFALAVAGLAAAVLVLWWNVELNGPGVTPQNVAAIRPGMTYVEVQALMGGPSGGSPSDVAVEAIPDDEVAAHAKAGTGHHWISRQAAVFVTLDPAGRVAKVRPLAVTRLAR